MIYSICWTDIQREWIGTPFIMKRDKPAPFLKYNKLPDKCIVDFIKEYNIKNACEFGCGEGRNAIYLAKNDIDTEAYDLSEFP